jgi:hypothetical protein
VKSSQQFAIRCPCGVLAAVPLPIGIGEDPTEILRSLPERDQCDIIAFYLAHEVCGEPEPCIVDIEPVAQA